MTCRTSQGKYQPSRQAKHTISEALDTHQDANLVVSPMLRQRGTKTGFYGFNALTKIESLEDLERYKNN